MKISEQSNRSEATLEAALRGDYPDRSGRFGAFGGRYVPETLMPALARLEEGVRRFLDAPDFRAELERELRGWAGRPTALTHAPTLSRRWGAEVWLKREDLAHTGAHKINNALGQALLARRMGKKRVIAETGAGQHGVATASVCAKFGLGGVFNFGSEVGKTDTVEQAEYRRQDRITAFKIIGLSALVGGVVAIAGYLIRF